MIPCVAGRLNATELLATFVHELPDDNRLVMSVDLGALEAPAPQAPAVVPVTDEDVAAGVGQRELWLGELARLKATGALPRKIEIASSRVRAQGPLAAEVATFDAALILGQGPPILVGDAVHMVMERVSLPDAPDLEQLADDVCQEGDIAEQTDDVISMCRACLQAPSLHRALGAPQWWREVPFVLATATTERSESPDRGPLVSGRVDLVYRAGDELVVVDYKTDNDVTEQSAEAHALEHHGGQAEVYAKALAAATGLPVREVAFVYCKAGVEVRLREGAVVQ